MNGKTQFYRTQDGVLARSVGGHNASSPEVHGPKGWTPYPELDTLHDARPISHADALEEMPAGSSVEDLHCAPRAARAPVKA